MTFSKLFQTTDVNFLFLDSIVTPVVELLPVPVASLESVLGMDKFSTSSDAI